MVSRKSMAKKGGRGSKMARKRVAGATRISSQKGDSPSLSALLPLAFEDAGDGSNQLSVLVGASLTTGRSRHLKVATLELPAGDMAGKPMKFVSDPAWLANVLRGLGHADRLAIMAELMCGPRTHQMLHEATGLKPGPLYHHIRELQRAGLIEAPKRNQYMPTSCGRTIFAIASGIERCLTNKLARGPWRMSNIGLARPRRKAGASTAKSKVANEGRSAGVRKPTSVASRKKKAGCRTGL